MSSSVEFAAGNSCSLSSKLVKKKNYGYDINNLLVNSILLRNIKTQKKLTSFFT
jgi:hypothetical protein